MIIFWERMDVVLNYECLCVNLFGLSLPWIIFFNWERTRSQRDVRCMGAYLILFYFILFYFFSELCWGKAMVAYTVPQQRNLNII